MTFFPPIAISGSKDRCEKSETQSGSGCFSTYNVSPHHHYHFVALKNHRCHSTIVSEYIIKLVNYI